LQRVQLVRLDPRGDKLSEEAARERKVHVKQTYARSPAPAVLAARRPGPLLVVEGPETGIALWRSTGHEVRVALGTGGLAKLDLPHGRQVIVCRDDDARGSTADRTLVRALRRWRCQGVDVAVATPHPIRRGDKSDFDDLLREQGSDAVAARIAFAADAGSASRTRRPATVAQVALERAVDRFFALVPHEGETPSQHAIRIDVAGGKSTIAARASVEQVRKLRAAGDDRTMFWAVPRHDLADQGAELLRQYGPELRVAVWRGRRALNPARPGQRMCEEPERVAEAAALSLDPQTYACQTCPLKADCAYQAQRERRADIWVGAHELMFHTKPAAFETLAAVVVDESPVAASLIGMSEDDPPPVLELDVLLREDPIEGEPAAEQRLSYLRRAVHLMLDKMDDGAVAQAPFLAARVVQAMADEARKLEYMTKQTPDPGEGLAAAQINRDLNARALFWRGLAALLDPGAEPLSGWLELATETKRDGSSVRYLRMRGRRPVSKSFTVPTLLLDATLQPEIARHLFPRLEVTAELDLAAPHQRVHQVVDSSFALSSYDISDPRLGPAERRRRERHVRRLRASVLATARRYVPGRVLVVAQKRVKEALERLGDLPPNVELAHHNAVTGLNRWQDVRAVIVIGRTQPRPRAVERMAAALTGNAVPPVAGWYQRADATRETADGGLVAAEVDRHPHSVAEAFRWRACEGELLQIIGRGRGVRREADRPLDVHVWTDVPLPLPVHDMQTAAAVAPSWEDEQLALKWLCAAAHNHFPAPCWSFGPNAVIG
jgi:hypothetical protein